MRAAKRGILAIRKRLVLNQLQLVKNMKKLKRSAVCLAQQLAEICRSEPTNYGETDLNAMTAKDSAYEINSLQVIQPPEVSDVLLSCRG
jgi:hypothetical protein